MQLFSAMCEELSSSCARTWPWTELWGTLISSN